MIPRPRPIRAALPLLLAVPLHASSESDPVQDDARDARFASGKEEFELEGRSWTIPWRLLAPDHVEEGVRYPLVLFLHGAGERGDDNARQLTWFGRDMASDERRANYPCFVLAPQCPKEHRWVETDWSATQSEPDLPLAPALHGAMLALRRVTREHPVDTDRILLTGLSMGGFGTWGLAARRPSWFAAVAPVCGGGDETSAAELVGLPLWAFHGAKDRVVPVERTRTMIQALHAAGGEPRYDELEGVEHDAWKPAYAEASGLLPWLLRQHREGNGLQALTAGRLQEGETIAFLGDSITESGAAPGGYVSRIAEVLEAKAPQLGARIVRAGISGNRVPDLLARFERDVVDQAPTLVFVYIGINDVWHAKLFGKGTPAEEFEAGLRKLALDMHSSGATVVLATPSVIGERWDGTNELDEQLDAYAAITRSVAAELDLVLCDLRRDFLHALELLNPEQAERGVLTTDGVHLNARGNAFVADRAAIALTRAAARRK